MNNPELELDSALYAALCIFDSGLEALPANAILLDEDGRAAFASSIVECFCTEKAFGFARAGRTIVLVIRTEGPAGPEQEEAFFQEVEASAIMSAPLFYLQTFLRQNNKSVKSGFQISRVHIQ